ncbi:Transducin/WD40 repeat-like superfamily protein isoform 1 [Hibiscus syriacus]|uniref:Transducin/WD40 repeat-like superfamily protein isoform 1 n=1 Tax=Hibiscus syriacus TaxID=106335 RepID=A0A6A2WQM2_HIBSY|nr:Transducin/WD40 repeat-like superfamily protein isoform 1 [Hibiscus syriacus]
MAKTLKKLVSCVILDLDGTLLNTDGVVSEVLKGFLPKYGKQWDGREAQKIIGKTPLEAAAAVVEEYGLSCGKDEFLSELYPVFSAQLWNIKPLPGAIGCLVLKCEFLEAAKRLNREPSSCLVIEDSIPGVTAGKVAGMEVVAVPYVPKQTELYTPVADEVINSVLDLQPENNLDLVKLCSYGYDDVMAGIEGTLPTELCHLSTEGHSSLLSEHPSGINFPSLESLIAKIHEDRIKAQG